MDLIYQAQEAIKAGQATPVADLTGSEASTTVSREISRRSSLKSSRLSSRRSSLLCGDDENHEPYEEYQAMYDKPKKEKPPPAPFDVNWNEQMVALQNKTMEMHKNLKKESKTPASRLQKKRQERMTREEQIESVEESKSRYMKGVDAEPAFPYDFDENRQRLDEEELSSRSVMSAASEKSDASVIIYGRHQSSSRLQKGTIPTYDELMQPPEEEFNADQV